MKRIRHPSPSILTATEQAFIKANAQNTTVLEFMKRFKRGAKIIYDFLDENEITPYRKVAGRPKTRRVSKRYFEFDKWWI